MPGRRISTMKRRPQRRGGVKFQRGRSANSHVDATTTANAVGNGSASRVLQLQSIIGNQAVTRLVKGKSQANLPLTPMPAGKIALEGKSPPTINFGSSGPFVEEAQQHLNAHGADPELKVDGIFGPKTKAAVQAFQSTHQDKDGNQLVADGIIGPLTWGAIRKSAPTSTTPEEKASKEKLEAILAKGAAMTPEEAAEAKTALFQLEGDEFRDVLKKAMESGAFTAMLFKLPAAEILDVLANLRPEVVIPTTLLKPAADTIDDDFKRANEIYNPKGIEIEKGNQIELSEKATKKLLGRDLKLTEFTTKSATSEELKLVEMNRQEGRIAGYWVPDFHDPTDPSGGSRGEALLKNHLDNLGDDRESVVINTSSRAQDTFPHEVGHALDLEHATGKPENLMAPGSERKTTGANIDQLTDDQIAIILKSVFMELGKKGVGK